MIVLSRVFLTLIVSFSIATSSLHAQEHVKFEIKNAGMTVEGSFPVFESTVKYDPENVAASSFVGTIKTSSISTGIDMRDEHLVGDEYFDSAKYPNMTFKSTSVSKQSNGDLLVKGKFTIKETSKVITLKVKPVKSGDTWWFETSFTFDRLDYEVGESSWVLSDDVTCFIKASAD